MTPQQPRQPAPGPRKIALAKAAYAFDIPSMKRKTLCKNGNTVLRWYDRITRSTVIQTLDASGNQIGEADYSGNKQSADFAHASILKKNGADEV